jgi:flavin reductase (DIM6/NTAB) family NADH-FMN oxidoreductase RutF
MSFDARTFRNALGCFPTGVVVVTAGSAAQHMGVTINSFASVSLEPPLVLWCMDRKSGRYGTFTNSLNFTVSVLSSELKTVSARLAMPGEHSLEGLSLEKTACGPPGLADALAIFECAREAVHNGGDHAIIIGRVLAFHYREAGQPLIYFRGSYGALAG